MLYALFKDCEHFFKSDMQQIIWEHQIILIVFIYLFITIVIIVVDFLNYNTEHVSAY